MGPLPPQPHLLPPSFPAAIRSVFSGGSPRTGAQKIFGALALDRGILKLRSRALHRGFCLLHGHFKGLVSMRIKLRRF